MYNRIFVALSVVVLLYVMGYVAFRVGGVLICTNPGNRIVGMRNEVVQQTFFSSNANTIWNWTWKVKMAYSPLVWAENLTK